MLCAYYDDGVVTDARKQWNKEVEEEQLLPLDEL